MAQQTAVEWLESKFQKFLLYYEGNHKAEPYTIQELSNDFEQAKQMEKEQIMKTARQCHFEGVRQSAKTSEEYIIYGEEYYNQIYNQNK